MIYEASIVAKSVVEFEFDHQRSWNHPEIVKLIKTELYMIHRGEYMMNFSSYSQYYREPRTQFNTSDHARANCSGGFDWWLTRRAYSFQLLE